jgi:ribonuclease VapC
MGRENLMILLDSSALLAVFLCERGADIVEDHLADAAISSVNLAEVAQRLARGNFAPSEIRHMISSIEIPVIPLEETDAIDAGLMISTTKKWGLSLGDRVCLSVAERLGVSILTADKAWSAVSLTVPIVQIR